MSRKSALTRSSRLQLVLPERTTARIARLKATTHMTTSASVIRTALDVMFFITTCIKDGDRLIARRPDGTEVELIII